ncbi:MAG: thiol:disulfide interchange protein DsbA/DsbL [Lautropia sp.]|nr:thiol:disulfide interchange protein DsbA/DsbL [Lautropia sp.]
MNRQQFLSVLLAGVIGTGLGLGASTSVQAQVNDKTFVTMPRAIPTEVPAGKIEVLEFFWYGCPHCYSLEPYIDSWLKKQPEDVVFRRVHVPFFGQPHQQLFFTLQAMGRQDAQTRTLIFDAIQKQRKPLKTVDEMVALLKPAGIDAKQFQDTYNSFGVKTAMQRANKLATAYGLEGVPVLTVGGRYVTSPSTAGSNQQALTVVDDLIRRVREQAAR